MKPRFMTRPHNGWDFWSCQAFSCRLRSAVVLTLLLIMLCGGAIALASIPWGWA